MVTTKFTSLLLIRLLILSTTVRSKCFLPQIKPPFHVGLTTALSSDPTTAPTSAPSAAPTNSPTGSESTYIAETARLNIWDMEVEGLIASYFRKEISLDEWEECLSDSVSFNLTEGIGSDLNIEEHHILVNTFHDLITDYSIIHGHATYISEDTIEVIFVEVASGDFGLFREAIRSIAGLRQVESNRGALEWESEMTFHLRLDSDGMINKVTMVSPKMIRKLLGALLTFYVTTSGPITTTSGPLPVTKDMETAGPLTLFGHNAFLVILLALVVVITMLFGMCVMVSMHLCSPPKSKSLIYEKVSKLEDI